MYYGVMNSEERLRYQSMVDQNHAKIITALRKLRETMSEEDFEVYLNLTWRFFKGTITMRNYLMRTEGSSESPGIVKQDQVSLHSQVRNGLCDIAETNLSRKKRIRRGLESANSNIVQLRNGNIREAELSDEGDIRARLSLASARYDISYFDAFSSEIIRDVVAQHIQCLLLSAFPVEIQPDGFMEPTLELPKVTLTHLKRALQLNQVDSELNEWRKEQIEKEITILNRIEEVTAQIDRKN